MLGGGVSEWFAVYTVIVSRFLGRVVTFFAVVDESSHHQGCHELSCIAEDLEEASSDHEQNARFEPSTHHPTRSRM